VSKLQFRVLYRVFLLRVIDLELLSGDGDASKLLDSSLPPLQESASSSPRLLCWLVINCLRVPVEYGAPANRNHDGGGGVVLCA
jgi:hypothetical protein